MKKTEPPTLGEVFAELLERIPDDRPDLLAKLTDEMWLISRFPGETFPDGPPQETVDRMRAARERQYR